MSKILRYRALWGTALRGVFGTKGPVESGCGVGLMRIESVSLAISRALAATALTVAFFAAFGHVSPASGPRRVLYARRRLHPAGWFLHRRGRRRLLGGRPVEPILEPGHPVDNAAVGPEDRRGDQQSPHRRSGTLPGGHRAGGRNLSAHRLLSGSCAAARRAASREGRQESRARPGASSFRPGVQVGPGERMGAGAGYRAGASGRVGAGLRRL